MIALFNADNLIHIFRDDPVVIQIGTRALKLQCATVVLLPLSMATEMLYQSTGKKAGASALSSFRGGVVFIPALLILAKVRGLQGIQEAQPASYVITAFASILFIWFYFRRLPSEDVQV